jgi:uncharacterized protein
MIDVYVAQTALTSLHSDYEKVMRISSAIFAMIIIFGAAVIEFLEILPRGIVIVPMLLLMAYFVWSVPKRRYARWGYDMSNDRLRISQGYMFHSDTIVPLGRIQHIDVDQGPIQRIYDLATLSLHTAGNHGATVILPGLLHADALEMREAIRAHIRDNISR